MVKWFKNWVFLGCCLAALGGSSAKAAMTVDLLGAVPYSLPTGTPTPSGGWGSIGGGLGLNFGLGSRFGLELAGFYLSRTYTAGSANTITMLSGVLDFKLYLGRSLFLYAGGYGNGYLTNPQSLSDKDLGVLGGLGLIVPLSPTVGLLLKGEYRYALNSLTYSGGSITPTDVVAYAGFSFGMNMR